MHPSPFYVDQVRGTKGKACVILKRRAVFFFWLSRRKFVHHKEIMHAVQLSYNVSHQYSINKPTKRPEIRNCFIDSLKKNLEGKSVVLCCAFSTVSFIVTEYQLAQAAVLLKRGMCLCPFPGMPSHELKRLVLHNCCQFNCSFLFGLRNSA